MRISLILLWVLFSVSGFVHAKKSPQKNSPTEIEVYRSPSCGCCGKWLDHLKANNFTIVDHMIEDVNSVKSQHGVTPELASCHTALVNGYVVEGHVPANDIKKMLKEKPAITGITVPGMPVGTPGMEMGAQKDAYDVLSFDKEQHAQVFNHYGAAQ